MCNAGEKRGQARLKKKLDFFEKGLEKCRDRCIIENETDVVLFFFNSVLVS